MLELIEKEIVWNKIVKIGIHGEEAHGYEAVKS
jgi:hypothetical protein